MTSGSAKREAPPVNPADLLAVWNLIRQARARKSPEDLAAIAIFPQNSCGPGADVEAVGARTLMLDILSQVSPRWMDQPNADKVIEVAARFPLNLPELGVESHQPPFDVREFMKEIAALKR